MVTDSFLFSDEVISGLQASTPDIILDFFVFMTILGNIEIFILAVTIYYWLHSREKGVSIIVLSLTVAVASTSLKEFFRLPRPPETLHLYEAGHYGFPSGHAMAPLVIYGAILYSLDNVDKNIRIGVGVALIFLISISRIFLGVHYPLDTLGGWFFGGLILGIYILYAELEPRKTFMASIALALVATGVLFGRYLTPEVIFMEEILFGIGGILGAIAGWQIRTDATSLDFNTPSGLIATVIGVLIVVAAYTALGDFNGLYALPVAFILTGFVVLYLDVIPVIHSRIKKAMN